jgi:hypothetical protein
MSMRYWVYTIGVAEQAPPFDWLVEWEWHRTEMWFPRTKRPASVSAGDRAVVYGSQGRGFLAAVEITGSEPERNPRADHRDRFPWILEHRLLVAKASDGNVASPESAGIATARIQRGPHTEIGRDDYGRAVAALLTAARGTAA